MIVSKNRKYSALTMTILILLFAPIQVVNDIIGIYSDKDHDDGEMLTYDWILYGVNSLI